MLQRLRRFLMNPWFSCVAAVVGIGLLAPVTALAQPVKVSVVSPAPAPLQKLLPLQSQILFTIHQMGVPVEGRFAAFNAQIAFDRSKPETGRVAFGIDLGSVVVGNENTVKELKKPDWFDASKFPSANFASTSIKSTGSGAYEIAGNLVIKGISKPVVIPVKLAAGNPTVAEGGFGFKRSDFKIGEGDWTDTSIVANEVAVRFKLAVAGL